MGLVRNCAAPRGEVCRAGKRGQERLTEENLHIRNYLENEKHLEQSKASDESLVEGRGVSGDGGSTWG